MFPLIFTKLNYLLFLFLAVSLSTGARLGWMLQDLVNQTKLLGLAGVHELVPLQ